MDDFLTALGAICFFISVYTALSYEPKAINIRAGIPRNPLQSIGRETGKPGSSELASAACHPRWPGRDSRRRSLHCERTSSGRIRSSRR
ncbi:hypothetical protein CupriaWKF_32510 [Cupriavidus sp. WKF15]|uniref:hypothetical protein n=1 Tax=Cupriavidus sp. WKF15 TaxID=3032282 RepID=UPI0023E21E68|nr:hypothetical protein [Cupriavidus sp. WKF15]WER50315.1 hypothetical protein CupriaWKF_32510 [Cupriavidus sp. WKF15]